MLAEIPEQFVDERSGRLMELNYDLQYNTSFGPIHEDYWERSLPLTEFPIESPLHVHVAAPVDIAISNWAERPIRTLTISRRFSGAVSS